MPLVGRLNEWIASVKASDEKLVVASAISECRVAVFLNNDRSLRIRFATDGHPECGNITEFLLYEPGTEPSANRIGVSGIYDPSGILDGPPPFLMNLGAGGLVYDLTEVSSRELALLFTVNAGEKSYMFEALLPQHLLTHAGKS